MSQEILTILLSIVSAIVAGAISILTIWAKKKWAAEIESGKLQVIFDKVALAVRGAEMVGAAAGWDSAAKKQWALEKAAELTGLTVEQLSTFVEAAVAQLKAAGEELTLKGKSVIVKP